MSINSLTDSEIRKSKAFREAATGGIVGNVAPDHLAMAVAREAYEDNQVTNALSMLVKYIPTESITLYIAALSAAAALRDFSLRITPKVIYWFFAILTPALVLVIYFGKRKVARLHPTIPSLLEWPWWKTIAASIAFLIWALAVPSNPYVEGPLKSALVGFLAVFVSTILSVFEPLFDRPADA
ncbi:MAG TPA: hypothetical protein VMS31_16635 [Pyrinomonadaceae bacterium]|nr:hypothetical protein [Pyrinomonadaceae bacterium]